MGTACFSEIVPAIAMAMTRPLVAPEDWTIMVKTRPIRMPSRGFSVLAIACMNAGDVFKGSTA
jgi:hypothetical protein